jgi:autotransporter-associated beta strand protein/autotransporter passenger strand-loop-strand repeat protein
VGLSVASGAFVSGVTVQSGGTFIADSTYNYISGLQVQSGGAVAFASGFNGSGMTFSGGVTLRFGSGTTLVDAVIAGGSAGGIAYVSNGATASNMSVYGTLHVSGDPAGAAAASATLTKVSSGGAMSVGGKASVTSTTVHNAGTLNVNSLAAAGALVSRIFVVGGTMNVNSGGTATGIEVSGNGVVQVSGSGIANAVSVYNGSLVVKDGGLVSATVVQGGIQRIEGGSASATTVSGGSQVVAGGVATSNTISAAQIVSGTGASAVANTIVAGGVQTVQAGGYASGNAVAGSQTVSGASASALSTTISSGAVQFVAGTGSALANAILRGGLQTVEAGGFASGNSIAGIQTVSGASASALLTTVSSGATQTVTAGGLATSNTVLAGGVQNVQASGLATSNVIAGTQTVSGASASALVTTVSSGKTQTVQAGGVATSNTILAGATQTVQASGLVTSSLVAGTQIVSGTAASALVTTVSSGGTQTVTVGGMVSATTLVGNAVQTLVGAGAKADATTVSSGGTQNVSSGGSATDTTLLSGVQNVYASGSALTATVSAGGVQRVSSGGLASGATILSGGTQTVYVGATIQNALVSGGVQQISSGATVTGTTIRTGDQHVYAGGNASNAVVSAGGVQNLSSGGKGYGTTVSAGGSQNVHASGSALTATVHGVQNVSTGGFASGILVSAGGVQNLAGVASATRLVGGTQNVSAGGSAMTATVSASGVQRVSSGGLASGTTVLAGGSQTVYVGATVQSALVSGGVQQVSTGATVTGTTIRTGAQHVYTGGNASNTVVSTGGVQHLSSGGKGYGTTVSAGGSQNVSSGGLASGTLISASGVQNLAGIASATTILGGTQNVSAGGSAMTATVSTGGVQNVSGGGSAVTATITAGGVQNLLGGGTAVATLVSGGTQNVSANGLASGATIRTGTQNLLAGAKASGTVVSSGVQNVSAGASATSTTLVVNGSQTVLAAGTALGTQISSGGRQTVSAGGTATSTTIHSAGSQTLAGTATTVTVAVGGTQIVQSAGYATAVTLAGVQTVSSGGRTSNVTINSRGVQTVSSGATATSTTINSAGSQVLAGTANFATIAAGGSQIVQGTGYASGVTLAGVQTVSSGGRTSNVAIDNGGVQTVSSGGSASATQIKNGGAQTIFASGSATSADVSAGGKQHVSSGGVVSATTVRAGGSQIVYLGGSALDASISSGGNQTVSSGGYISRTFLYAGANQNIAIGATALETTLVGATQNVSGIASGTVVSGAGAIQNVLSGGSTTLTTVSDSGVQNVSRSGTATSTLVGASGVQNVAGLAIDAQISSGGRQNVTSGGSAADATVSDGGAQHVSTGGIASGTKLGAGGSQTVSTGGSATETTVDSGAIETILSRGIASGVVLSSGGALNVALGGSAREVFQSVGGILQVTVKGGDSASVSGTNAGGTFQLASGSASNFILYDGGTMTVSNGGTALRTLVSSGGVQTLMANGLASTVDVSSGGTLAVSGGSVGGDVNIRDGAVLTGTTVAMVGNGARMIMEAAEDASRTVTAGIVGSGAVSKVGAGTVQFVGKNTYAGSTVVVAGTLAGNVTASASLTVSAGAVYAGSGVDGLASARAVGGLSGAGDIRYTDGFSIGGGVFTGSIDDTNIGGITKTGSGTLILAGANDYLGGVTISGGTLGGNLVEGRNMTLLGGGTYDGAKFGATGVSTGLMAHSIGVLSGTAGTLIKNTNGLTVEAGVFAGNIDSTNSGALAKVGSGTLVLAGSNAYRGSTVISEGRLAGNIVGNGDLTILSGGTYAGGAYNTAGVSTGKASRVISSLLGETGATIAETSGLTISTGNFDGVIDETNVGGLVKSGTGTLVLAGDNTYQGSTVVAGGSLVLNGINAYQGGTRIMSGATLIVSSEENIGGAGADAILSQGGTLQITGDRLLADIELAGSGEAAIKVAGGVTELGGDITGTGALAKNGSADDVLLLTGRNSYTGGTTISGGTLAGNIAAGTNLTIKNSGVYDGATYAGSDGYVAQEGVATGRSIGTLSGAAGTTIKNTSGLSVAAGSFGGVIDESNVGGLVKVGSGTLVLTGETAYLGDTVVEGGTLSGNIASNTSLTVEYGAIYDGGQTSRFLDGIYGDGNVRLSGYAGLVVSQGDFGGRLLTTDGSLTKVGEDTLTLTGASAFTGYSLDIQGGRLELDDAATIAPKWLTMKAGTTLDISQAGAYAATPLTLHNLQIDHRNVADGQSGAATVVGNLKIVGTATDPGFIRFYMPSETQSGSVLLAVEGNATVDYATINLTFDGAATLATGERLTLVDATGTGSYNLSHLTISTDNGSIFTLQVVGNDLVAVRASGTASDPVTPPADPTDPESVLVVASGQTESHVYVAINGNSVVLDGSAKSLALTVEADGVLNAESVLNVDERITDFGAGKIRTAQVMVIGGTSAVLAGGTVQVAGEGGQGSLMGGTLVNSSVLQLGDREAGNVGGTVWVDLTNAGQVEVEGTWTLAAEKLLSNQSAGTITVNDNATLDLMGGSVSNDGVIDVNGGTVQVMGSAIPNLIGREDGNASTQKGRIAVHDGGTLTAADDVTVSPDWIVGGTNTRGRIGLGNDATFNIYGDLNLSGGGILDVGASSNVEVFVGRNLNVSGSTDITGDVNLHVTSALDIQSGTLKVAGAATIAPSYLSLRDGTALNILQATAYGAATPLALRGVEVHGAAAISGNVRIGGTASNPGFISFDVASTAGNGSTFLSVAGNVTVDHATLYLTFPDDTVGLSNSQKFVLIDVTDSGKGEYVLANLTLTANDANSGADFTLAVEGQDLVAVYNGGSVSSGGSSSGGDASSGGDVSSGGSSDVSSGGSSDVSSGGSSDLDSSGGSSGGSSDVSSGGSSDVSSGGSSGVDSSGGSSGTNSSGGSSGVDSSGGSYIPTSSLVVSAGQTSTYASVTLSGSAINTGDDILALEVKSGGVLQVTGALNLAGSAAEFGDGTLRTDSALHVGDDVAMNSGTLQVVGTGGAAVVDGGTLRNYAAFNLGDRTAAGQGAGQGGTIGVNLRNSGVVRVLAGSWSLTSGGTLANLYGGTVLVSGNLNLRAGSAENSGYIGVNGGTLSVTGSQMLTLLARESGNTAEAGRKGYMRVKDGGVIDVDGTLSMNADWIKGGDSGSYGGTVYVGTSGTLQTNTLNLSGSRLDLGSVSGARITARNVNLANDFAIGGNTNLDVTNGSLNASGTLTLDGNAKVRVAGNGATVSGSSITISDSAGNPEMILGAVTADNGIIAADITVGSGSGQLTVGGGTWALNTGKTVSVEGDAASLVVGNSGNAAVTARLEIANGASLVETRDDGINVLNNGTLAMGFEAAKNVGGTVRLASGGTISVSGIGDISKDDFVTFKSGLVNGNGMLYTDAEIEELKEMAAAGSGSYDDLFGSDGVMNGLENTGNNQTSGITVTDVKNDGEGGGTNMTGTFGAAEMADGEGNERLNVSSGTLALTGGSSGGNLVTSGGSAAGINIGGSANVTLGASGNADSGVVKDVTVAGGGTVTIAGDVEVQDAISGGGTVAVTEGTHLSAGTIGDADDSNTKLGELAANGGSIDTPGDVYVGNLVLASTATSVGGTVKADTANITGGTLNAADLTAGTLNAIDTTTTVDGLLNADIANVSGGNLNAGNLTVNSLNASGTTTTVEGLLSADTANVSGGNLNAGAVTAGSFDVIGTQTRVEGDVNVTGTANVTEGALSARNVNAGTLNVNAGNTLNAAEMQVGTLAVTDATVTVTGNVGVNGNATLTDATFNANELMAERLVVTGGETKITNDISVTGSAEISGGTVNAGYLSVSAGDLTMNGGTATVTNDVNVSQGNIGISGGTLTAQNISGQSVSATGAAITAGNTLTVGSGGAQIDGGTLKTGVLAMEGDTTLRNDVVAEIDSLAANGKKLSIGQGSDTQGATVKIGTLNLGGGTMLLDPSWDAENPTTVAIAGTSLANSSSSTQDVIVDGKVGVGRNSYLAFGTSDTTKLPELLKNANVDFSENGVTAAMGVFSRITVGTGQAIVVDGSKFSGTDANGTVGTLDSYVSGASAGTLTFAKNSLLAVSVDIAAGSVPAISIEGSKGTVYLADNAKLMIAGAKANTTYEFNIVGTTEEDGQITYTKLNDDGTVGSEIESPEDTNAWTGENLMADSPLVSVTGLTLNNGKYVVETDLIGAAAVLPDLSPGQQTILDDMELGKGESPFLRNVLDALRDSGDTGQATKTIESAARIATQGAVIQTAMLAANAASVAPTQRLTLATGAGSTLLVQPVIGSSIRAADRTASGLALWIAPMYQTQEGWGVKAGSQNTAWTTALGGVAVGADVTMGSAIRLGANFQLGGGYAKGQGDLAATQNNANYWGIGAYAGLSGDNTLLALDINYTKVNNSLKQELPSGIGDGSLSASVVANVITAGLRGEYRFATPVGDFVPYTSLRYMRINTDGYSAKSGDMDVLKADATTQTVWTFPTGVTFAKDVALSNGWYFKPTVGAAVIPATGDTKAKSAVRFVGVDTKANLEAEVVDSFAYQGQLGAEFGDDTLKFGLQYLLTASEHTASHAGQLSFRLEF